MDLAEQAHSDTLGPNGRKVLVVSPAQGERLSVLAGGSHHRLKAGFGAINAP
jgi:hypothetical protein